jgi:hypothetical protein
VSTSIETDKLDALYKRLKPAGVTMTALLAKAVGNALVKHPVMFASEPPRAGAGLAPALRVAGPRAGLAGAHATVDGACPRSRVWRPAGGAGPAGLGRPL